MGNGGEIEMRVYGWQDVEEGFWVIVRKGRRGFLGNDGEMGIYG